MSYKHQWSILLVFFFCWGVLGLVRNSIAYLFPFFSLTYGMGVEKMGFLASVLAIFWGLGTLLAGKLANSRSQLQIFLICFAMIIFALLGVSTIPMQSMLTLFAALGGLGCGCLSVASIADMAKQSNPTHRGMFLGIMQAGFSLIGIALGSFFIIGRANTFSWRVGFLVLLGITILVLMLLMLRLKGVSPLALDDEKVEKSFSIRMVLAYKNMRLAVLLTALIMCWSMLLNTYLIIYLLQVKMVSTLTAGAVFSTYGLGCALGTVALSVISDYLGRKLTLLICLSLSTISFAIFLLGNFPMAMLMLLVFLIGFLGVGLGTLAISIIPSEGVPVKMITTATSLTPTIAEATGGIMAPAVGGILIAAFGIKTIFIGLLIFPILMILISLALEETAPMRLATKR